MERVSSHLAAAYDTNAGFQGYAHHLIPQQFRTSPNHNLDKGACMVLAGMHSGCLKCRPKCLQCSALWTAGLLWPW